MRIFVTLALLSGAAPALAQEGMPYIDDLLGADVIIIGEVHDNPFHHENQAAIVRSIDPPALVFEMFGPDEGGEANVLLSEMLLGETDADLLADVLKWKENGWPDFDMYVPIIDGAPAAILFGGAVDRHDIAVAMESSAAEVFGEYAIDYALDEPLPEAEQAEREAMQFGAHCEAIPETLLPKMVEAQRLRDATLADTAVIAWAETYGPVVIITGNGHARADWGIPHYLRQIAPDMNVITIGQEEDGKPLTMPFDYIMTTAGVDRGDPCEEFG